MHGCSAQTSGSKLAPSSYTPAALKAIGGSEPGANRIARGDSAPEKGTNTARRPSAHRRSIRRSTMDPSADRDRLLQFREERGDFLVHQLRRVQIEPTAGAVPALRV